MNKAGDTFHQIIQDATTFAQSITGQPDSKAAVAVNVFYFQAGGIVHVHVYPPGRAPEKAVEVPPDEPV